ncbi:hypothetical protein N8940_01965 [Sphingomonadaceae bacterium]|nr:hypothetical protein [Sphingomonadaceae bacterium]
MLLKSVSATTLVSIAIFGNAASAQTGPVPAQTAPYNEENWRTASSDEEGGGAMIHLKSGAICVEKFRELALNDVRDYTPDGTNSSCQHSAMTEAGMTRLTTYFYTYPGITGQQEFVNARSAISQIAERTATEVTERSDDAKRCHAAIAPRLAQAVAANDAVDAVPSASGEPAATFGFGLAMYDLDTPAAGDRAARKETSVLLVYQFEDWVVKVRATAPHANDGDFTACNLAGLSASAQASVLGSS